MSWLSHLLRSAWDTLGQDCWIFSRKSLRKRESLYPHFIGHRSLVLVYSTWLGTARFKSGKFQRKSGRKSDEARCGVRCHMLGMVEKVSAWWERCRRRDRGYWGGYTRWGQHFIVNLREAVLVAVRVASSRLSPGLLGSNGVNCCWALERAGVYGGGKLSPPRSPTDTLRMLGARIAAHSSMFLSTHSHAHCTAAGTGGVDNLFMILVLPSIPSYTKDLEIVKGKLCVSISI